MEPINNVMQAARPESDAVVVVEDDDELRGLMVSDLAGRGMAVVGVASAEALYRHLAVHPCRIVVLDVGLPGEDGYAVARHLRQVSSVGIVMLTARGSPGDMARGLDTGADLYLVKPVEPEVLAAGLASLHRRLAIRPSATQDRQGAWSLVAGGWSLRAPQGQEIALGKAERAFLQRLLPDPGKVVGRETLIDSLTESPKDFDPHRLEVLVHRLRARVKSVTGRAFPVRAIRGAGYLFDDGEGSD